MAKVEMDGISACTICGTREDALDNLTAAQLLINICGHKFCKTCTDRKFSQRSTFACPACGIVIKRNTISEKTLDEIEASEDLKVRKRINNIYNKVESDFESLRDFNDYQEMKEDIIYDIVHDINKAAVEAQIERYQRKHANEIRTRLAEGSERDRQVEAIVLQQKKDSQEEIRDIQARDARLRKVEKETRRQELQIRMGERTTLSEDLIAAQREQAALTGFGVGSMRNSGQQDKKRPISSFMSQSVSGLADISIAPQSRVTEPVVKAVPKIVEQFLQQRPLPKFIPALPTVGETRADCLLGGLDLMSAHRRYYAETFSQFQMYISTDNSTLSVQQEVSWPCPF